MRHTASFVTSVAAATIGPLLATAVYRLDSDQRYLWNQSAAIVVLAVALLSLLTAALTAAARTR